MPARRQSPNVHTSTFKGIKRVHEDKDDDTAQTCHPFITRGGCTTASTLRMTCGEYDTRTTTRSRCRTASGQRARRQTLRCLQTSTSVPVTTLERSRSTCTHTYSARMRGTSTIFAISKCARVFGFERQVEPTDSNPTNADTDVRQVDCVHGDTGRGFAVHPIPVRCVVAMRTNRLALVLDRGSAVHPIAAHPIPVRCVVAMRTNRLALVLGRLRGRKRTVRRRGVHRQQHCSARKVLEHGWMLGRRKHQTHMCSRSHHWVKWTDRVGNVSRHDWRWTLAVVDLQAVRTQEYHQWTRGYPCKNLASMQLATFYCDEEYRFNVDDVYTGKMQPSRGRFIRDSPVLIPINARVSV